MFNPDQLMRLSEMGPVAHLIALLCLFSIVLMKLRRKRPEAFWPAMLAGLVGVLVGGGAMLAGVRILGLKVLSTADIDRIVRNSNRGGNGGRWRGGRERAYRGGQNYRLGEERLKLAMFVRVLDQVTKRAPDFLEEKQAGSILSMLEVILPMPRVSDREAVEILANIDDRLSPEQRQKIREISLPRDPGIWSVDGRLLENPFHSKVNSAAVIAFQKRYEHINRTTVPRNLLDL
jgi:hypothetical protein